MFVELNLIFATNLYLRILDYIMLLTKVDFFFDLCFPSMCSGSFADRDTLKPTFILELGKNLYE
jgi:hypothetical protein